MDASSDDTGGASASEPARRVSRFDLRLILGLAIGLLTVPAALVAALFSPLSEHGALAIVAPALGIVAVAALLLIPRRSRPVGAGMLAVAGVLTAGIASLLWSW